MNHSDLPLFDFRGIAAMDDTAESFRNWISKSSSFFSEFWGEASGYGAQLTLGSITTESYDSLLSKVSKDDVCVLAELQGHCSSLWYASPAELRKFVFDLLGVTEPTDSNNPLLTAIETSLVQLCIEQLVVSLNEGWMGEQELVIQSGELEKDPRKSRLFRAKDLVTKATIQFEMKTGTANLNWILPKQKTCDLLETTIDQRSKGEPRKPTIELVEQLPVELVSALGQAMIPMPELSKLRVGQLVMLDQKIDEPVTAFVDGEAYYECWPGKVGTQQALQVHECLRE